MTEQFFISQRFLLELQHSEIFLPN